MEPRTIRLCLLSPPGVNNLYFDMVLKPKYPSKKPRVIRVLSEAGKAYKSHVEQVADGTQPFIGDVWVTFKWYRPRRIGDLDGIFKVILDGLKGFAYNDDKQVARIWADRFDDAKRPRVEIEITALGLC